MTDAVIDLSLGEAEALIVKAAHGAGFSWGLSIEAGAAVRRSAQRGEAEVADEFAAFLTHTSKEGAGPPGRCPLRCGFYAIDGGLAPIPPAVLSSRIFIAVANDAPPAEGGGVRRFAMSRATHDALDRLAHRTYAPATEDSRRRGAG